MRETSAAHNAGKCAHANAQGGAFFRILGNAQMLVPSFLLVGEQVGNQFAWRALFVLHKLP